MSVPQRLRLKRAPIVEATVEGQQEALDAAALQVDRAMRMARNLAISIRKNEPSNRDARRVARRIETAAGRLDKLADALQFAADWLSMDG